MAAVLEPDSARGFLATVAKHLFMLGMSTFIQQFIDLFSLNKTFLFFLCNTDKTSHFIIFVLFGHIHLFSVTTIPADSGCETGYILGIKN